MEPLNIICDTCSARLKVRDSEAIGQILSCPKCQSMVLVEAPEGWAGEEPALPGSSGVDQVTAPPLPDEEESLASSEATSAFDDASIFTEATSAEDEIPASTKASESLDDLAMPTTVSPWAKLMASHVGRWGVIGGGAAAMVLLGVIGWAVLGSDDEPANPEVAQQQMASNDAEAATAAKHDPKDESVEPADQQEELPPAQNPFAEQNDSDSVVAPTDDDPPAGETRSPFDNGPTEGKPEKTDPLDPIIRQPSEEDRPDEPTDSEKPAGGSTTDLLQGMDLLDEGELFGVGSGMGLAGEAEVAEPQVNAQPKQAQDDPAENDQPVDTRVLPEVDVEKALALPMIGARYERVRMTDFLEAMSDLTRVPITLDLDALEPLKLGPASRVSVRSGETTAGELVEKALKDHHKRLAVTQGERGLIVAPIHADRPIPMEHPIDDLAEGEEEQAALIEMIKQFVMPGTWVEAEVGSPIEAVENKLRVQHTMQAQFQVIVLLEKLRAARNLPSRNRYFDPELFALKSRRERADARLAKTVNVNEVIRQPLSKLVRKLEWASATNIAVDWAALREEKIGRETPVRLIARGKSLSEAMDELVGQLDLAWLVHDGKTLQISTAKQIAERREVEVFDLRKVLAAGLGAEALVAGIRRDTNSDSWQPDGDDRMQVAPGGSCLIVLASQETQVQIANALARMREQNLARGNE